MTEQLEIELQPFRPPAPAPQPEPLRCDHCKQEITEAEVFIHNDNGRYCADSTCIQAGFRTLL